jgi:uncharacterized protein YqeY
MTEQTLKVRIKDEMKAAMRAKQKQRLVTIRSIQAEIKRIEVDERIDIDDARLLVVLDKMCKQRRDSIQQFTDGDRADLAEIEQAEMLVIQEFLPAQFSEDDLKVMITEAISSTGAEAMKDMGKVMAVLKPKLQGRADMGAVSKLIKASL